MKKIAIYLLAASLALTFIPLQTYAVDPATVPAATAPGDPVSPEVARMISRVNEIKAMDKSELSSAEKKSLRKELRSLKHELKSQKGVFLSVGAIIIIILLLILIL